MCIQDVKALGPEMLGAWYVKKNKGASSACPRQKILLITKSATKKCLSPTKNK